MLPSSRTWKSLPAQKIAEDDAIRTTRTPSLFAASWSAAASDRCIPTVSAFLRLGRSSTSVRMLSESSTLTPASMAGSEGRMEVRADIATRVSPGAAFGTAFIVPGECFVRVSAKYPWRPTPLERDPVRISAK